MKKKFITKKIIRWKTIDTIALIVILIISAMGVILNSDVWVKEYSNNTGLLNFVFLILMFLFYALLVSIPYLIIYFSLRYAIKKYNKSVVSFDINEDIEYYREKFKGINPATMSLLMDLNLENDKDLGAMKLYYELNNVYMYVKEGKIEINNPKGLKLNNSDTILLQYFFDKKNKIEVLKRWKDNIINENINNNLIVQKNKKERKKVGCGIFLFLHIFSLIYIVFYSMHAQDYMNVFDVILCNRYKQQARLRHCPKQIRRHREFRRKWR